MSNSKRPNPKRRLKPGKPVTGTREVRLPVPHDASAIRLTDAGVDLFRDGSVAFGGTLFQGDAAINRRRSGVAVNRKAGSSLLTVRHMSDIQTYRFDDLRGEWRQLWPTVGEPHHPTFRRTFYRLRRHSAIIICCLVALSVVGWVSVESALLIYSFVVLAGDGPYGRGMAIASVLRLLTPQGTLPVPAYQGEPDSGVCPV